MTISRRLEKLLDHIDNEIDIEEVLRRQLNLNADNVVMSVVLMEGLGVNLERNDLEQAFIAAHNRVMAKVSGTFSFLPLCRPAQIR